MLSLNGLYEFFETLRQRGQWVAFAVGIVAGGGLGSWICYLLCRAWMPSIEKGKHDALRERLDDLVPRAGFLESQLTSTTTELDSSRKLIDRYVIQVESLETSLTKVSADRDDRIIGLARLSDRLHETEMRLAESQAEGREQQEKFSDWLNLSAGKRWDQPAGASAPRFRPLHTRQMPIISVVNLKGGVGKTTVTANLGAIFAKQHRLRVLLIDLDYQGSLTDLCLSPQELQDVRQSGRVVSEVLQDGVADRAKEIFRCATRLEDLNVGEAFLLATEDELDDVELRIMGHWKLGIGGDDVRFRLREALHSPVISNEFDIVLIDCPPRLSAGCLNALAASDFVLGPVLLERLSFEAAPKLLHWLKKYHEAFCPELAILGILGNRVRFHMGRPVQRQMAIWDRLKDLCREAWGSEIRFFDDHKIPSYTDLPHRFASLNPQYAAPWLDLAEAILKELPPNARRRPGTIHPVPRTPLPSIRG